MEFTVRPFEKTVENADRRDVSFSGMIAGRGFVVRLAGYEFSVPIVRAGSDDGGPFAVIAEGEVQMGERWSLVVEPEHREEFPDSPGCHITVRRMADRRPYEEAAREGGHRLGEVELVVPTEAGASVFFNGLGHCDGAGWDSSPTASHSDPAAN